MKIVIASSARKRGRGRAIADSHRPMQQRREGMDQIPHNLTLGDPYLYDVIRLMQRRHFNSGDFLTIIKKAQRIRKAYQDAHWASEADWPFFVENLLDKIKHEGARPTIDFCTDHLSQTMASQSVGNDSDMKPRRKKYNQRVGRRVRTRNYRNST